MNSHPARRRATGTPHPSSPGRPAGLWRLAAALAVAGGLTACSTTDQNKVASTAVTPLSDLNLVKAEIPQALEQARRAPYQLPAERSCELLNQQIQALDEALGPDLDAPASEPDRGLLERGVDEVAGAALGSVQRTAESVLPFRSWVRKLSGAERHSRKVQASITAGGVRRAFLKGMRASMGCGA